jgi:hypothetical protein
MERSEAIAEARFWLKAVARLNGCGDIIHKDFREQEGRLLDIVRRRLEERLAAAASTADRDAINGFLLRLPDLIGQEDAFTKVTASLAWLPLGRPFSLILDQLGSLSGGHGGPSAPADSSEGIRAMQPVLKREHWALVCHDRIVDEVTAHHADSLKALEPLPATFPDPLRSFRVFHESPPRNAPERVAAIWRALENLEAQCEEPARRGALKAKGGVVSLSRDSTLTIDGRLIRAMRGGLPQAIVRKVLAKRGELVSPEDFLDREGGKGKSARKSVLNRFHDLLRIECFTNPRPATLALKEGYSVEEIKADGSPPTRSQG